MIIHGHPDILLGPQGLNGLHGFGSSPDNLLENASPAYIRFLYGPNPQGIEALYKEIRDFVSTHNAAEIDAAAAASGVSYTDIANATASAPEKIVDTKTDYVYSVEAPAEPTAQKIRDFNTLKIPENGVIQPNSNYGFAQVDAGAATGQSPAYTRYLNSLPPSGGAGFDPFYTEILAYQNSHTHDELLAQMVRLGVSQKDVDEANAYAARVAQQAYYAGQIAKVATDATATTIAQGGNTAAIAAAAADAKRATAEAAALAQKTSDLTKTRQAAVAAETAQVSATAAVKTTTATTLPAAASAAAAAVVAATNHVKAVTHSAVATTTGTAQSQGSGLTFGVILTALAAYLFMG
jgi:hypothetical protein